MSSAHKNIIHCFLSSETEYIILYRTSQILRKNLTRLSAKVFDIQFEYHDASKVAPDFITQDDICIRSLLHHALEDTNSSNAINECYPRNISNPQSYVPNKTFLLTIFHYINPKIQDEIPIDITSLIQRIRSVNLQALKASNLSLIHI